jgi:micrococcal nuclease
MPFGIGVKDMRITSAWAGLAVLLNLAPGCGTLPDSVQDTGPQDMGPQDMGPQDMGPQCQVSHVVDGDTLHLTCDGVRHKVRLLGFDTPEVFHPLCAAEARAGEAATRQLEALAASGPVTGVRFQGHDRYGRDLARVEIAGQDVAAVMLGSGLARAYQGGRHPDWCGMPAL